MPESARSCRSDRTADRAGQPLRPGRPRRPRRTLGASWPRRLSSAIRSPSPSGPPSLMLAEVEAARGLARTVDDRAEAAVLEPPPGPVVRNFERPAKASTTSARITMSIYATDEDIALRASTDFSSPLPAGTSCSRRARMASSPPPNPWTLTSASIDFAAYGLKPRSAGLA